MAEFIGVLVEFGLEVAGDFMIDLLSRSTNPVVRTMGSSLLCTVFGLVFGALSIALIGHHIVSNFAFRTLLLCVIPVANGLLMAWVGSLYEARGKKRSGFERFIPAFIFSLVFGMTRYFGAQ